MQPREGLCSNRLKMLRSQTLHGLIGFYGNLKALAVVGCSLYHMGLIFNKIIKFFIHFYTDLLIVIRQINFYLKKINNYKQN